MVIFLSHCFGVTGYAATDTNSLNLDAVSFHQLCDPGPESSSLALPENRHEHMTPSLSTALSSRADNCEMPTLRAVLLSYLVSFTCLLTLTSHFENVHPTKAHLAYCSGVV